MKNTHNTQDRTCKSFMLIIFTLAGMASSYTCGAQAIAGKWKEISGKNYCTSKGVKSTGKQFLPLAPQGQILEIKSDNTFTTNELMMWIPSTLNLKGTWSLSGDQLTTKLDAHQPDPMNDPTKEAATTIYTITFSGNNMILLLPMKGNPIIEKMEKTYARM
jgi:hypothetical protein